MHAPHELHRTVTTINELCHASNNQAIAGSSGLVLSTRTDIGKHLLKAIVIGRILAPVQLHIVGVQLTEPWRAMTQDITNARRIFQSADPDATIKCLDQRTACHLILDEIRQQHLADEDATTR